MKFNGRSGVQLRAPRDLSDLAAYTALKFYLQSPNPASSEVTGDQFVLYMGSRQVLGKLGGRVELSAGWSRRVMLGLCLTASPHPPGHW